MRKQSREPLPTWQLYLFNPDSASASGFLADLIVACLALIVDCGTEAFGVPIAITAPDEYQAEGLESRDWWL